MHFRVSILLASVACCAGSFTVGRLSLDPAPPSRSMLSGDARKFPTGGANRENQRLGPRPKGLRPTGPSPKNPRIRPSVADGEPITSPSTRADLILKNPNRLDRTRDWFNFIKNLDSNQLDAVALHMRSKELDSSFGDEYTLLLSAWAEKKPLAALEHARQSKRSLPNTGSVIVSWAAHDPEAAISWANETFLGNGKTFWMECVITGVATHDLQRATNLAEQLPDADERTRAVRVLSSHYAELGTAAALDWAMSMDDERCRNEAILSMARALSKKDPASAAEILLTYPTEKTGPDTDQIVSNMAMADLDAALGYLDKVTDQTTKSRTMRSIIMQLSHTNPKATIDIMDSNRDLVSDDMVRYLAGNASNKEPEFSTRIIGRIQDASVRNEAYKWAITSWIRKDADSAIQWMNENELSPELRRWADGKIEQMRNAKSKDMKKP